MEMTEQAGTEARLAKRYPNYTWVRTEAEALVLRRDVSSSEVLFLYVDPVTLDAYSDPRKVDPTRSTRAAMETED